MLLTHRFPRSRDAEDKICASIVDSMLTKVAAEERADWNRRRRSLAERELEKRNSRRVEAETISATPPQGASGEQQGRMVRMLGKELQNVNLRFLNGY